MTCSGSLPGILRLRKTSSGGRGTRQPTRHDSRRAAAGGRTQALEGLREQRGLPWLGASWLDVRLATRLLVRNWGLTLVGGVAMTLAIAIAAVVFAAFDILLWSGLPLDDGDRVVAIQVWDREAARRRDATWQDLVRWRTALQSVEEVGAFQAVRRNIITPDGSVELVTVAEISAAGFESPGCRRSSGARLPRRMPRPALPRHPHWPRRLAAALCGGTGRPRT